MCTIFGTFKSFDQTRLICYHTGVLAVSKDFSSESVPKSFQKFTYFVFSFNFYFKSLIFNLCITAVFLLIEKDFCLFLVSVARSCSILDDRQTRVSYFRYFESCFIEKKQKL